MVHTARAQPLAVERGIEPVTTDAGGRIHSLDALDEGHRQPRGGVHRQVERYERRVRDLLVGEARLRDVNAGDLHTLAAQPRSRRGQPERLTAEVIRRNQQRPHAHILTRQGLCPALPLISAGGSCLGYPCLTCRLPPDDPSPRPRLLPTTTASSDIRAASP